MRLITLLAACFSLGACSAPDHARLAQPTKVRVMTFNVEDIRAQDLLAATHPRLDAICDTIRSLDPDILVINELAFDQPGSPGWPADNRPAGSNAQRFAERLNSASNTTYIGWMPESNTGIPSGFDLDRNGAIVTALPHHPPRDSENLNAPPRQTADQRVFGGDSWGFGTFPGQYAIAVLVKSEHSILHEQARTYRKFRWADLPSAQPPILPTGEPWYPPEAWAEFRLSSKTHALVPVRLASGAVIQLVLAHPTPPAFDGQENRNKLRNRDEIRLLRAMVDNEPWLLDDQGNPGGLNPGAHAVVMGDLNADPQAGSSIGNPIAHLLASPRMAADPEPASLHDLPGLDPSDTSGFRLRVDYVLPTASIQVVRTAVHRDPEIPNPSDHFPVWADLLIPAN